MPLIYSLVARETVILAEFTSTSGNFTTVTRRILERIPQKESKMSYVYDRHIFHILVEDALTFLCMADEEFGRRIPFAFLDDIKNRFVALYASRGRTALAYAMNEDFSRVLQKQMEYYSTNPNADKVTKVKEDLDNVKSVMVQNIEKVLDRGERIELLVDKTENLNQAAVKFKKQSTQLKKRMWWKNAKLYLIIAVVLIIIVLLIVVSACGGLSCARGSSPSPPPPAVTDPPEEPARRRMLR